MYPDDQPNLAKTIRDTLSLAGIDTMESGKAFLPDYIARFATAPARSDDLHRPMNLAPDRVQQILCKREQCYVGSWLPFSVERRRIMLQET